MDEGGGADDVREYSDDVSERLHETSDSTSLVTDMSAAAAAAGESCLATDTTSSSSSLSLSVTSALTQLAVTCEYTAVTQDTHSDTAAASTHRDDDDDDDDYQSTSHVILSSSTVTDTAAAAYETSSAADAMRTLYEEDNSCTSHTHQQTSPQHHSSVIVLDQTAPVPVSRGFTYTAADDLPTGHYSALLRADIQPPPALDGLSADGVSYMTPSGMSSSYMEPARASLIDSSSSYSMSLPPYPAPDIDQSKLVNRIPTYLPYAACRPAVDTPRTIESPSIYGGSVAPPVTPAFPSDAFTKDFFGQYLHDTPPAPLHPLATHQTLRDQHAAAAAGILGYQQSSTLPTMPHPSAGGSELFRRAYSGVSDNIFGGIKSPAQTTIGPAQPQHWMSPASDTARRWNHTPPSMHQDMSRYVYPPGRTELNSAAKTLGPGPAPMSKRLDDVPGMFTAAAAAAVSSSSSSVDYALSAGGPPPYPHTSLPPAVNSSHRQLEDAYRQMTSGDYRSLAHHHRTASEMYGSALSSLDRYYYSARDAMYRSQQLAAAMPHAFMPQSSQYTDPRTATAAYVRDSLPSYGQCPAPSYGLMCPTDKQYLSGASARTGDYLESSASSSQDSYSRHSMIYNMMPRYF